MWKRVASAESGTRREHGAPRPRAAVPEGIRDRTARHGAPWPDTRPGTTNSEAEWPLVSPTTRGRDQTFITSHGGMTQCPRTCAGTGGWGCGGVRLGTIPRRIILPGENFATREFSKAQVPYAHSPHPWVPLEGTTPKIPPGKFRHLSKWRIRPPTLARPLPLPAISEWHILSFRSFACWLQATQSLHCTQAYWTMKRRSAGAEHGIRGGRQYTIDRWSNQCSVCAPATLSGLRGI